jgi:hypothetical protein
MEYAMTEIKYPSMRMELRGYLDSLSDAAYQEKVWLRGEPHGSVVHDNFGNAVHFLFDDTELSSEPLAAVGDILRDATEADQIVAVVAALEVIFDKYGTRLSDAEYVALPEWQQVLKTAASALAAIPQ